MQSQALKASGLLRLFAPPRSRKSRQEPPRPPVSIGLPDSLLGLRGGHSVSGCRLRLIMSGGKFRLGGAKFAGQIAGPGTELLDQRLGGDQARGQTGDFILLLRVLSTTVLDLLDDVRPIDFAGDRLAGS